MGARTMPHFVFLSWMPAPVPPVAEFASPSRLTRQDTLQHICRQCHGFFQRAWLPTSPLIKPGEVAPDNSDRAPIRRSRANPRPKTPERVAEFPAFRAPVHVGRPVSSALVEVYPRPLDYQSNPDGRRAVKILCDALINFISSNFQTRKHLKMLFFIISSIENVIRID